MPKTGVKKKTLTDQLHSQLRGDILAGRLKPGQRLKFPDLCEQYGVSVGVVREALTRLSERGFVSSEAHQGFAVVELSMQDLNDLTMARLELEGLVLRLAIADGDLSWEASLIAAHHTLEHTPFLDDNDGSRISDAWSVAHAGFHEALLNGCANERLRSIAFSLRDSAELYRRWSLPFGSRPQRDLGAEHHGVLEATLAHDENLAVERLQGHIMLTTDLLAKGGREALEGSG